MNTIIRPTWDEIFFSSVYRWAAKSKDPRTKIGAVLVDWEHKDPFSHGYNGFPRGVIDSEARYNDRNEKYFYVCHAEANAIFNCARAGRKCKDSVLYTNGVPCSDCTKAVIQAGIKEVVVHKQWQEYEQKFNWGKWNLSTIRSTNMLNEAGIPVRIFDGEINELAMLDGKVIKL